MKTSEDILKSIYKTTQMGQLGIQSVLSKPVRPALKQALDQQLQEYGAIEAQALGLMKQRGISARPLAGMLQPAYRAMTAGRLITGNKDSKIAAMMVQGNTRGMVKGLKNMHAFTQVDAEVCRLSQKLYETEVANVSQMKPFL